MLSRIFATASAAVPATHAGGNRENSRLPRPATSSARCTAMTRWMYFASSSPRLSITSALIASSSVPSCSICSSVRWAAALVGAVMRFLLQLDVDVARCAGDAGADGFAGGVVDVARAQVADRAGAQPTDARVADAHAAAVRQQRTRRLAGHHERDA